MLCSCLLLPEILPAAEASAPACEVHLPSLPLAQALEQLATQCEVSAGMAGALPSVTTRPVVGRYPPDEILARMLAGSSLVAQHISQNVYRLQLQQARAAVPATTATPAAPEELDEVLVTASKRATLLRNLPLSVTVVSGNAIADSPLNGTEAALRFDPAIRSTHLGPGLNRHFIRGVADSPFAGPSQATVSVQFDEARLNYSAPDPDLRLLDVDQVEILKGPQGPLYGTGALGGVIHIVPRRPNLAEHSVQAAALLADTAHGGLSSGGSLVVNVPLVTDAIGLRAVAYAADESGWIDNEEGRSDANSTGMHGARLALRARSAGWNLDLQGLVQQASTHDSRYVTGAGPALGRTGVLPEPRDNDLYLVSATMRGTSGMGEWLFSSNYVNHEVEGVQDASASAGQFGIAAPARYRDQRDYHLFSNELRVTGEGKVPWLAGIAHLSADSRNLGSLSPAPAAGATVLDLSRGTTEFALFGEATLPLRHGLRLTGGMRLSRVGDEREHGTLAESEAEVVHAATPSLSFDWTSTDRRRFVYLRYASALRPGGLDLDGGGASRRFQSDELSSLDLGVRLRPPGDALTLQSALFATRWLHVQSDYLLPNGLVSTHNVGNAESLGVESNLQLALGSGFAVEVRGVFQHARLDAPVVPVSRHDPRLPVVPDASASLSLSQQLGRAGWMFGWEMRVDYAGASRLSFEPDLDRRTPSTVVTGLSASATRDHLTFRVNVENLADSRADTFAFGNPFSVRSVLQKTPLQPRTVLLQLESRW